MHFNVGHALRAYKLPGGHTLRIVQDRELDLADPVLCQLEGPTVRHGRRYVAAIGAGTSAPRFSLHSATNGQVHWITTETMPWSILYIVDFESRSFWPGFEGDGSATGSRLLALVNSQKNGYHLHLYEWIGVKG